MSNMDYFCMLLQAYLLCLMRKEATCHSLSTQSFLGLLARKLFPVVMTTDLVICHDVVCNVVVLKMRSIIWLSMMLMNCRNFEMFYRYFEISVCDLCLQLLAFVMIEVASLFIAILHFHPYILYRYQILLLELD